MYRASSYVIFIFLFSCMRISLLRIVEYGMPTFFAMSRHFMSALRRMHPSQTARSSDPSGALSRSSAIVAEETDLMNLLPVSSIPFPGLPRRRFLLCRLCGCRCFGCGCCPPFRPAAPPLPLLPPPPAFMAAALPEPYRTLTASFRAAMGA